MHSLDLPCRARAATLNPMAGPGAPIRGPQKIRLLLHRRNPHHPRIIGKFQQQPPYPILPGVSEGSSLFIIRPILQDSRQTRTLSRVARHGGNIKTYRYALTGINPCEGNGFALATFGEAE